MEMPKSFYKEQIKINQGALQQNGRKLLMSSMARLLAFALILLGLISTWGNVKIVVAISILGVVTFLYLVTRHSRLKSEKQFILALIAYNETELSVLSGVFEHLPKGETYTNDTHQYSRDIDLLGRGSFFQYVNRTALNTGRDYLAKQLKSNDITSIQEKQKAIKELGDLPLWRQQYSAIASLIQTEVSVMSVEKWLLDYKSFVPKNIKTIASVFGLTSLVLILLYFLNVVSGYGLFGWFLLGLGITAVYLKKINTLSSHTAQIQMFFDQYHKLLLKIEEQEFTSDILNEKRGAVVDGVHKSSALMKKFAKHLDALDQRSNILVGIVANGFMLQDLRQAYNIEQWIKNHGEQVSNWFQTIAFFDGYNSLGNYAFNHPENIFPEIQDTNNVFTIQQGYHPLLDSETRVSNDFVMDKGKFFIVTGANMAGKSTFLRTVAMHIVMANLGLPICAQSAKYSPIKLITSMRTEDSLANNESYFFRELKRLKFIVENLEVDGYFVILDEILKGTNSTDKALGSRKFIDTLSRFNATGIIATHDLSLCAAADELDHIENYYFDAAVINDELHFDYELKQGVCQNMNASFMLRKMKIVE